MGKRPAHRSRPQAQKDRATSRDLDRVRAIQDLRRSSASEPVPSGRTYRRTVKHRNRIED